MRFNELIKSCKKAGRNFYIGKDSEGWNDMIQIVDTISKLGNELPEKSLNSIIREINFIEDLKKSTNYPLIADSLYFEIPKILSNIEKGDE